MNSFVPPDLQQNIFYTIYFTIRHNFAAIVFAIGIAVFAVYTLYKPTRAKLLILYGFTVLLFSFEYSKHIIEPLTEQTTNSLITMQQHNQVKRVVNLSLTRALPLGLNVLGISLIAAGIIVKLRLKRKSK